MAEVVGEIVCGCGRRAYIERTKRRGNYLQKRCGTSRKDGCGLDQSTGDWVQKNWSENMVPVGTLIEGQDYHAEPKSLIKEALPEPESNIEEEVTDPEPQQVNEQPKPEQNRRIVEEDSGFSLGKLFVGLLVVAGAVTGIRVAVN